MTDLLPSDSKDDIIPKLYQEVHPIITQFDNFSTYHQNKCFEELNYLTYKEIIVGYTDDVIGTGRKRRFSKTPHHVYYLPISETVQALLTHSSFFSHINTDNNDQDFNGAFTSVYNGMVNRQNPLAAKSALQILLYYDEVELCNALGSKVSKHKLGFFYISFGNIETKFRSKLENIYLLAICNSNVLKKFGIDVILKPFFEELNQLQNGYDFKVGIGSHPLVQIKGYLSVIIGDTLAVHQMLGLKEGVGFSKRKRNLKNLNLCFEQAPCMLFSVKILALLVLKLIR